VKDISLRPVITLHASVRVSSAHSTMASIHMTSTLGILHYLHLPVSIRLAPQVSCLQKDNNTCRSCDSGSQTNQWESNLEHP
jgi:hypothetical protein